MLFWNSMDVVSKQILCLRHLVVLGSQTKSCYSKSVSYPSPPKRNKSAWLWFVTDIIPTLKKEFPERKATELMSLAGEKWRKVDQDTLEKYQKVALNDKKQYLKALENYEASLTPEIKLAMAKSKETEAKTKQKKHLKALGMPKRPPNAYILFAVDYAKKNFETSNIIKVSSKIGSAWANLPDSEKSKWNVMAAEKDKEYRKNLELWETEMVSKGHLEVVHTKDKR